MPLRVHCPNGCLLKLPAGRAGQNVRCHECGSVLKLPAVSKSEQRSGKPIPVYAQLAAMDHEESSSTRDIASNVVRANTVIEVGENQSAADLKIDNNQSDELESHSTAKKTDVEQDANSNVPGNEPSTNQVTIPDALESSESSVANDSLDQAANSPQSKIHDPIMSRLESLENLHADVDAAPNYEKITDSNSGIDFDFSQLNDEPIAVDSDIPVVIGSDDRYTIHDDRRILVRFFACCIALLGVLIAVPAIWQWWTISSEATLEPLPRWVFILVFIGGLHVVYGAFLIQVTDWSALLAVSVVMVVLSAVYGFFAAGVWLDEGGGLIVQFLQMPTVFLRNATIWILVMLCFSALASYIFGREAFAWKRATH